MPTSPFTDVHKHVCALQLALCGGRGGGGSVYICCVCACVRACVHVCDIKMVAWRP